MIINHTNKFVFIHIPKCAGTYVRGALEKFDETGGKFASGVQRHPDLGPLDYFHIPLRTLNDHFQDTFARFSNYTKIAIVRDPYYRFPSSIAQRLRLYKNIQIHKCTRRQLKNEIDEAIHFLSSNPDSLNPHYIHFRRQVDFIFLDDVRIVDNLYTLSETDKLLTDIARNTGISPVTIRSSSEEANRTKVKKNILVTAPLLVSQIFFPRHVRKAIREKYKFKYISENLPAVFKSKYVQNFVSWFYHDDIFIFNNIDRYR